MFISAAFTAVHAGNVQSRLVDRFVHLLSLKKGKNLASEVKKSGCEDPTIRRDNSVSSPQSVAASGPCALPQTLVEFDRQVLSVFAEELVVVVVDGPQRREVSGLHAGEEVLPPASLQLHQS